MQGLTEDRLQAIFSENIAYVRTSELKTEEYVLSSYTDIGLTYETSVTTYNGEAEYLLYGMLHNGLYIILQARFADDTDRFLSAWIYLSSDLAIIKDELGSYHSQRLLDAADLRPQKQ